MFLLFQWHLRQMRERNSKSFRSIPGVIKIKKVEIEILKKMFIFLLSLKKTSGESRSLESNTKCIGVIDQEGPEKIPNTKCVRYCLFCVIDPEKYNNTEAKSAPHSTYLYIFNTYLCIFL